MHDERGACRLSELSLIVQGLLVALAVSSENTTTTSDNDKQNEKDQDSTSVIESTANITGHVHCTSFVLSTL